MSSNGSADIVFTGGGVYTVDGVRSWARAVAVRGELIVAVGTEDDVRPLVGLSTEIVDLRGRMLLPGFQDAHVHAPSGGLDRIRVDLSEVHSMDGYAQIILAFAKSRPDAEWILGGGWAMDVFPGGTPPSDSLDSLVPDRPAYLANRDNHAVWVNSKALEMAGVDAGTPDPPDGRIERNPDGSPQGTLHEGAMNLVRRIVPPPTREEQAKGLLLGQEYLHSLGITAWQDAIVGEYSTLADSFETYMELDGRGELTAKVIGALWWRRDAGEEQVEFLLDRRRRTLEAGGKFRATSVKVMQDGVCENFTAAVLDPYLGADGRPTDNRGVSFVDGEALKGYAARLDREGFQVHIHAIGERAVREALDAIEAARLANGWSDGRHHIAHLQIVHPEDIPRFRALGASANCQPLWAAHEPQMDELTIPFIGPERATWQYPFRSLARNGAQLAMGSDWPVSSPNPLWEIHVAVNRIEPPDYPYAPHDEAEPEALLPEERLELPGAIAAFTMGSAYVNHLDAVSGSIEVGKLADLAVLDRNLFEHPVTEISSARVLLTLAEGGKVFETSSL